MEIINRRNNLCFWIVLFLSISLCHSLDAQRSVVVDSLENNLLIAREDSTKADLFLGLSWEYHNSNPAKTIEYAKLALSLSERINYGYGIAKSYNLIGIGLDIQGELDPAMEYYEKALEVATRINNQKLIGNHLNNIGLIYERKGNYNTAMEYYHRSLAMVDKGTNKSTVSILMNNIGLIHSLEGDYGKALEYLEQSLTIERELDDKYGITMALTSVGEQYSMLGQAEIALKYYEEALPIAKEIDNKVGESMLLCLIGEVYLKNEKYKLALDYFPEALKIANQSGDKSGATRVLNNIGKVKLELGQLDEAVSYCMRGLAIAQKMGAEGVSKDIYETLSESYAQAGKYQKAFEYHKYYQQAKDSLHNQEKSKQIAELSTKYETQKKESEVILLKEQQAKNQAVIRQRTIIGWGVATILFLVSLITVILLKSNRRKHAYNQQLEEEVEKQTKELKQSNIELLKSNKELERFTFIASHDLKEPLRNVVSFTRLIERRLGDTVNDEIKEFLSFVVNNSRQMHTLIEDVLEFSSIENRELDRSIIDLNEILKAAVRSLCPTITEKKVSIKQSKLPKVKGNPSQILLVITNLIDNGMKYNDNPHPAVRIETEIVEGFHQIAVIDNGMGIEEQYFNTIFEMFKRLHHRGAYQGSGLGLAICKKIIQNLGGDIWVESKIGEGSRFVFSLPVIEQTQSKPVSAFQEVEG